MSTNGLKEGEGKVLLHRNMQTDKGRRRRRKRGDYHFTTTIAGTSSGKIRPRGKHTSLSYEEPGRHRLATWPSTQHPPGDTLTPVPALSRTQRHSRRQCCCHTRPAQSSHRGASKPNRTDTRKTTWTAPKRQCLEITKSKPHMQKH